MAAATAVRARPAAETNAKAASAKSASMTQGSMAPSQPDGKPGPPALESHRRRSDHAASSVIAAGARNAGNGLRGSAKKRSKPMAAKAAMAGVIPARKYHERQI